MYLSSLVSRSDKVTRCQYVYNPQISVLETNFIKRSLSRPKDPDSKFLYLGILLSLTASINSHLKHLNLKCTKATNSLRSKVDFYEINFQSAYRLLLSPWRFIASPFLHHLRPRNLSKPTTEASLDDTGRVGQHLQVP